MITYASAKINLGLQVLRKRADGFHDISTLMLPIPFRDVIELNATGPGGKEFELGQSGITVPGATESNLIYRSWKLFSDTCGKVKVKIHIHKQIPPGAGLGGGSSDAAAVLKALNTMTGEPLDRGGLLDLAAMLGSDCPVFIENKPVLAGGRGELLSPAPVRPEGYYLVLLHPGMAVSTPWAYSQVIPADGRPGLETVFSQPVEQWKTLLINDFETPVFRSFPAIAGLKASLYMEDAVYASMSGSGSAVYGLFKRRPDLNPELQKQVIWEGWI